MRNGSLALAAMVPLVGLAELILHLFFARRPPAAEDFLAARPRVEALKRPGDLLLIAPRWLDPHARAALGPALLPLRDLTRPEEARYRRAIVLEAMGQRAQEIAGWREIQRETLGSKLSLAIFENPTPISVVRDLVDEVEAGLAEVTWVFPDREVVCPWKTGQRTVATGLFSHPTMPAQRYVCGGQPWQSVGVTVHDDQDFRPRRCVWAPPPQGGYVRLRFPPGEGGKALRGHGSIHWTLERERRGGPVFLEFWLGTMQVGEIRHEDGQGWARFEVPLQESPGGIEVRVRAPVAAERHFCWEGVIRK